jgi:hypothetical protein
MNKAASLLKIFESSFDLGEFKKLTSYKDCLKYALNHLTKIGAGSSRVVFDLGDGKILKVAKNAKGIDQNDTECDYSIGTEFVAKLIDCHPDNLWVIFENAPKVKSTEFKRIVGIDFKTFQSFIQHEAHRIGAIKFKIGGMSDEVAQDLWENDFCAAIAELMANYDLSFGDLARLNSYGKVTRNGKEYVVLRDYGLTQNTYKTHYTRK